MAVYAVGDIQGCQDEFLALLEAIAFKPARDRLWLVGDLVNRGPASLGVLRTVRELGDAAIVVLGNHDLHLLALASGHGRERPQPGLAPVLRAPDRDELLSWLASRPLLHRDRALGWTLVHAGLPPQWSIDDAEREARAVERALAADPADFLGRMYGDLPDLWTPALRGQDRLRFTVNCLTRLRYVDADGRMLLRLKGTLRDAPAGALPWFRHPARASAGEQIVFGHWSALGYLREGGTLALDSGCVWGGSLTAVCLDREAEPVSVPCSGSLRPGED